PKCVILRLLVQASHAVSEAINNHEKTGCEAHRRRQRTLLSSRVLVDIFSPPATKGTQARTTAVKRARNTLATPYLRINCALRSISQGKRLSGQPRSICRR